LDELLLEAVEKLSRGKKKLAFSTFAPLIGRPAANLTAAYQMNNFEPVARLHVRGNPLRSGKNFEIAFNRDAIGRQSQVYQQGRHAKSGRNFPRFSVYQYLNS